MLKHAHGGANLQGFFFKLFVIHPFFLFNHWNITSVLSVLRSYYWRLLRVPHTAYAIFCWWLLCTITTIVYLQGLLHYNTRTKCLPKKKYRGLVIKFRSTFWSGAVSWSSAAKPILNCKTTSSFPFQYYFMIYLQFSILRFSLWCSSFFFRFTCVYKNLSFSY